SSSAALSDLRPLGIEPDEAAAVRLVDGQVAIAPLVRRKFDGCDVTIAGEDSAKVTVQLRESSASEAKEIEVTLGQLAGEQYRAPLDALGGYLLVHRTPGDELRVHIARE